jgi:predicted membrane protein
MINTAAPFIANPTDCIDSNTIFGEVKKIIISKDFKGGKINNVFGKTELDFTSADIRGLAVLDVSETFGETVIIVPEDWRVETDQTLIMATYEDNRQAGAQNINPNKVLIITGCSIFASIKVVRGLY